MTGAAEILIILPSIHDILAVEDRVRDAGLWVDVLPKPTSIANDCGMVLGCRGADLDAFLAMCRTTAVQVQGIYAVRADGYERLTRPERTAS